VHAKRRAHVPEGACASQRNGARAKRMAHMPKGARACEMEGTHSQGRIYVFLG
jgi:hypothetical protein